MIIPEERRDYSTRPQNVWRCECCGWWQPRYARQVNAVPSCPYCSRAVTYQDRRRGIYTANVRLWAAVRRRR